MTLWGKYILRHPTFDEVSNTIPKMSPVSNSVFFSSKNIFPNKSHHHLRTRIKAYPSYSIIGIQYHRSPSQITQILELANRDNGLREGVGEYSAEYSPYSRNKPFTPILPVRTIFSPILYLPARLSRTLYSSRPLIRIYCPRNHNSWRPAMLVNPGP